MRESAELRRFLCSDCGCVGGAAGNCAVYAGAGKQRPELSGRMRCSSELRRFARGEGPLICRVKVLCPGKLPV